MSLKFGDWDDNLDAEERGVLDQAEKAFEASWVNITTSQILIAKMAVMLDYAGECVALEGTEEARPAQAKYFEVFGEDSDFPGVVAKVIEEELEDA